MCLEDKYKYFSFLCNSVFFLFFFHLSSILFVLSFLFTIFRGEVPSIDGTGE